MVSRTPAPLKIHVHSHLIYKSSAATASSQSQEHRRRPPLIIHTMTPKVIYSKVNDFKTLVQKLTGLPHPPAQECSSSSSSPHPPSLPKSPQIAAFGGSLSSSSSFFDNYIGGGDSDVGLESAPPPADPFLSDGTDIFNPLTPDEPSDFFCPREAPEPFYEPSNPSMVGVIERSEDAFFLGI